MGCPGLRGEDWMPYPGHASRRCDVDYTCHPGRTVVEISTVDTVLTTGSLSIKTNDAAVYLRSSSCSRRKGRTRCTVRAGGDFSFRGTKNSEVTIFDTFHMNCAPMYSPRDSIKSSPHA